MRILIKGKNQKILEKQNLTIWRLNNRIYLDYRNYIDPLIISIEKEFILLNNGFFENFNETFRTINFPKAFFLSSGFLPILNKYVIIDSTFNYIFFQNNFQIIKKTISSTSKYSFFSKLNGLMNLENINLALSDGMDSAVLKSLLNNNVNCSSIVNSLRIRTRIMILYSLKRINLIKINFKNFLEEALININNLTWSVPNIIDYFLIEKYPQLIIGHTGDFLRNGHYTGDSSIEFILKKYFRNYPLDKNSRFFIINYIRNYFKKFDNHVDYSLKVQSFGYIHRQLPFLIGSVNIAKSMNKKVHIPFWDFNFAYFFLSKNVSKPRLMLFNDFYKSVLGSKYYLFQFLKKIHSLEYKFFLIFNRVHVYQDTFRFRKFNKVGLTKYVIRFYERVYSKR